MSIVFSAITPHPPVMIPEIGKENTDKLEKTIASMKKLEQDLYVTKPDTIVVISPVGKGLPDAFSINLSPKYVAHYNDFGNFDLEQEYHGDTNAIQKIRAGDEQHKNTTFVLTSDESIDYGFGVPLYYLTQHLKQVKIIPITYSPGMDMKEHFEFGVFLNDALSAIDRRFAVIASTDLSNKLTKDSPGGFDEKSAEYDEVVQQIITSAKLKDLVSIDKKLLEASGTTGHFPLAILAGILNDVNIKSNILSYEAPFGVGYMVAEFMFA